MRACPSFSISERAPLGLVGARRRLLCWGLLLPRSLPRTSPGWRWCRPSSRHCAGRTRRGPRGTSGRGVGRVTLALYSISMQYAVWLCSLQYHYAVCSVRLLVCSAQQRVSTARSSRPLQHKQLIRARPGPGAVYSTLTHQLCGRPPQPVP